MPQVTGGDELQCQYLWLTENGRDPWKGSSVPPHGCNREQASSSTAEAKAAERDEVVKQVELLRSLLCLFGCLAVPAVSLLRACLCGPRVKIVDVLSTVAFLLTEG